MTVTDETGQISIPIFADKNIDNQKLTLEKFYIFLGIIDIFNNVIEIIPQSKDDITEEQTQQLGINKDNIGEIVTIEGAVITKYMHPDGHTFLNIKTTGNGANIEVPLFKTLNYNSDNLTIQSIITVKGKITEYKGKLEVIPEKTEDINIISKGDESKVEFKNIKNITNNDRGKMITSHAYVTNARTINGHTYFTLTDVKDENSRIDAVLFSAETKELSARKTVIYNASKGQFQVWVLAMVDIYDDKLELIIDKADIN